MRILAAVLGGIAGLLFLFLLVGVLLTGNWVAEESLVIDAPPEVVFPYINRVAQWEEWTVWPEGGLQSTGPEEGIGAGRSWDDEAYGSGSFTITESVHPRQVRYRVEGGSLAIDGSMTLDEEAGGAAEEDGSPRSTRVTWTEFGEFGRNPLLGYMARHMANAQGKELARGLEQLKELVEREQAHH